MNLIHKLTHTAKCAERFKEHRAGSLAFLPGVFGAAGVLFHHRAMKLRVVSAASCGMDTLRTEASVDYFKERCIVFLRREDQKGRQSLQEKHNKGQKEQRRDWLSA